MSTETLFFPVEQAEYNTDVPTGRPPRNKYDVQSVRRLSTFHMPRSILVQFGSDDSATFHFVYPNEEAPERTLRSDPHTPCVLYSLGRVTRKVLSVRVERARECLAQSVIRIDPSVGYTWANELPGHARFACQRNLEVIANVMASMPDDIRVQIVETVKQAAGATSKR